MVKFITSFILILLFSNSIKSQNDPGLDALIYKDNKVFLRISMLKNDKPALILTQSVSNEQWEIKWQSADEKSMIYFSITGNNSSLSELEKWLFEKGFNFIRYNGQVIPVSLIEESYVNPESPERVEFRRNK
jgi:hypothetical protein